MRRDLRIVFAGGGTGGHVFPAIYMAEYLSKQWGADCQFIGTKNGLENRKVSQAGFLVRHIWISGFKRGFYISNLLFPLKLFISSMQSKKILRQIKPHLVIGTGGYVAGPALRQAIKMQIPTAIQEQNSYPGVTTRLLAPKVDCVLLAYEEALKYLGKVRQYRIVGNPIKEKLKANNTKEAQKYFGLQNGKITILAFGGSQGASNINHAIDEILSTRMLNGVQIIWQTGQFEFDMYKEKYKNFKDFNICILPFIDRMDLAYTASSFAITRAGAMTISELIAVGLPAILIPYPFAAADHQLKNARTIINEGAALLVEDNQDLAKNLNRVLFSVLESPDKIKVMAEKMHRLHRADTLSLIEEELAKLIENDKQEKF
jgi:UDP-N-acetylglucosamine--N-acetylmuramyl-(pentapeptide) pyrophosphoryl-undecaprenol N-acetylglucosamine transferase